VIQAVDGARVAGIEELIEVLDRYRPGDAVTLSVLRDGRAVELQAVLGTSDDRLGSARPGGRSRGLDVAQANAARLASGPDLAGW
jgi:hypothetical protein